MPTKRIPKRKASLGLGETRSLAFGDQEYRYDASASFNSTPDTSMTLLPACLFGEAPASPSISTGKERDTESGNDYFGARYYASTMGRWLSPDWSAKVMPVPYAKLDNPHRKRNAYS
jgi:RHS repeat-associated protein